MNANARMSESQRAEQIKAQARQSGARLAQELQKQEEVKRWPWVRRQLHDVVCSHWFEAVCGMIILFNMVLVVFETDASVDGGTSPLWIGILTNCLLGIYSTELTVKLYVYRLQFFREIWNVLDFVIVGIDLVFICIALIVSEMPSISMLRVIRLVRLARAFKAAKSMKELNSLLRACTCAMKAIFWGMVMMCLALTVWGILAVQMIHPINQEIALTKPWLYKDCDRCPRAFATVFDSILTFWQQLVAGDSWGTLCNPIVEHANWTFLFFIMVTVSLTMLNCILAVVVEAGASAAAADLHDKAMEHEKTVMKAEGKLIDLCEGLDADASGSLNIEEFLNGYHNNTNFRECLEVMHVSESDMFMIFNICDEDDSGDVDYREFVDQLRRIKHSGEQMLLHYVTDIRHAVNRIRPECLKTHSNPNKKAAEKKDIERLAEEKRDEGANANEVQSPSAAEALQEIPSFLADLLNVNDSLDTQKMGTQVSEKCGVTSAEDKKNDVTTSINLLCKESQLNNIFRINEDLVAIMSDVAQQSKVQTTLLQSLAGRVQGSGACSSTELSREQANIPWPWRKDGQPCPSMDGCTPRVQADRVERDSVVRFAAEPHLIQDSARSGTTPPPGLSGCCVRAV